MAKLSSLYSEFSSEESQENICTSSVLTLIIHQPPNRRERKIRSIENSHAEIFLVPAPDANYMWGILSITKRKYIIDEIRSQLISSLGPGNLNNKFNNKYKATTFDGRRPLTEDDLSWKKTFDGRRPLTEDDLEDDI